VQICRKTELIIDIFSNANNFFYLLKQTPAVFAEEKHIFAAVHLPFIYQTHFHCIDTKGMK
jgi:hypothetical protein